MSHTFERGGLTFKWEWERDDDMGHPWEEHDGHGAIRYANPNWHRQDKKPHEIIILTNRGHRYIYDLKATLAKAKEEGWGLNDDALAKLKARLGCEPTQKQITREAVDLDIKFCTDYLNGDVEWLTLSCWPVFEDEEDGSKPDKKFLNGCLYNVFEDQAEMLMEVHGLADEILEERQQATHEATIAEEKREAELDLHMAGL